MKPHPWFNPPYRRVLTVAFCLAWLAFETYWAAGSIWFYIMAAITGWAIWDFFLSGHYPIEEAKEE